VRGLKDPIGTVMESWSPAKRHADRAGACAARCHRHHL
jgi:hypothetical protein